MLVTCLVISSFYKTKESRSLSHSRRENSNLRATLLSIRNDSYPLHEMDKRNPIWWKRRTGLGRGLMVVAVSRILLCIALAVGTVEALGDRSTTEAVQIRAEQARFAWMCSTRDCFDTAISVTRDMDPDVDPCDNFYQFACGRFLNSTFNFADQDFINSFTFMTNTLQEQLRTSIAVPSKPNERKPMSLIKNLYKSCINTRQDASIIFSEEIEKLGGWPLVDSEMWNETNFDWLSSIYKFRDAGYPFNHFIDIKIEVDMKNNTRHVITLDQANLVIPRSYATHDFNYKPVYDFYQLMLRVAEHWGAERGSSRVKAELRETMMFEMELANISLPYEERRNAIRLYNPMTLNELTNNYSSIRWREYLGKLLPKNITVEENEILIVKVPSFISDLEKLLSKTSKRVLANYVMWRAAFYSILNLAKMERWTSNGCVDLVIKSLPVGVQAMYAREYSNEETRQKAVEMFTNIREQLEKILQQVEWMDNRTRQSALEKVAALSTHISYSDEFQNDTKLEEFYENLELSGGNYLHSILNVSRFNADYSFSKFGKPVNRSDWISHVRPVVFDGFYSLIENSISLPAGFFQGKLFSKDRPRYMNYGAAGSIVGHGLIHSFDNQERQFDKTGDSANWWTPSSDENYLRRAECITHQYENYTVEEVGLNLNVIKTQTANIADNAGIKLAYLAYNNWAKRNEPEKKLPGLEYSPNQMFWISAANVMCTKYKPEALSHRNTTNSFSPAEFRIIGSFSNMPEFSEDFNCPIGSKMNPEKKCSVW